MVDLLDRAAQNTMVRTSQADLRDVDRKGLLWSVFFHNLSYRNIYTFEYTNLDYLYILGSWMKKQCILEHPTIAFWKEPLQFGVEDRSQVKINVSY